MEYLHRKAVVSNIIKGTKEVQLKYAHEEQYKERLARFLTEIPNEICMYEGIPLCLETVQYMNELLKLHPEYKFGVNVQCDSEWIGVERFHDVWVYREHDKYALGKIGYVNMSAARNRDKKPKYAYCVYSRAIQNNKYKDHKWQHHSQASTLLPKAIKLADKHLRIYAPVEVAKITASSFGNAMKELANKNSDARQAAVKDLDMHDDRWVIEFRHMMDAGYEFKNPNIKGLVDQYLAKHDEYLEYKMRRINGWNIQTAQPMYGEDEQYVHVTPFTDFHKDYQGFAQNGKRMKLSALSLDVAGKLTSLMLLNDGKYVDGIGYRVDEDNFWVMTDEVCNVI